MPTERVVPLTHVVAIPRGGETVLWDADRYRFHALDDVGARIWALLEEGAPVPAIAERLRRDYSVPAETAEADVTALIERLLAAEFVKREAR